MKADDLRALLLTGAANIRWVTGFSGSSAKVYVPSGGEPVLVTDGRYVERASEEAPGWTVVSDRAWGWLADHHDPGTPLAVEADHMTWAAARQLEEQTLAACLRPTTGVVETLRQIKDDREIDTLRRACAITVAAFEQALGWLSPGLSEQAVTRRLVDEMIDLGADASAFEPIVAAGSNGSRPHHSPGTDPIRSGHLVTMDFGALVDGYHADMTRTVAVGTPDPDLIGVYEVVRAAQHAGVALVADGVGAADVDRSCREVIEAAGHGDAFLHPTGHGVGLDIHESPILSSTTTSTLHDRMTVTVEPGVYIAGLGGVRIEDVVLVGPTGAERLTTAPRQLITL